MKFLKSLLMGTGGVVLAGLVLALLAPKAVHAVVATAVQVVNTSANPAITEDTSRQASQIVTIQCQTLPSSPFMNCEHITGGINDERPGPNGGYVVPANQYFVLKSIDDYTFSNSSPVQVGIFLMRPQNPINPAETIFMSPNSQISFASGIVAPPGTEVLPGIGAGAGLLTFHGYLTSN
jgi:hypothetical protein